MNDMMEYEKLKTIAKYPTGKLNSNAAVEGGQYPFFTCAHEIYSIDRYTYDGEYVLLGGNNANGDFPIYYYNGKFDAYQRTYLIQSKNPNYLTKYLYYAIQLRLKQMQSNASGTATKYLTLPILNGINIEKRCPDKQKLIIGILDKYDLLIENNNKRIKILEQIAEELYKEWFVRCRFPEYKDYKFKHEKPKGWVLGTHNDMKIPQDWSFGKVENIGNFSRGKNITKEQMIEGNVPVISAGIEPSGYHNATNVKGMSLTMSASGANAGYLKYNLEDIWAADCSYYQDDSNIWFMYHSLNFIRKAIDNLQVGSAQPHVYPKNINKLCIMVPEEKYIKKFNELVSPVYLEIKRLQEKNKNLEKQRDLLLPRLMSGKLEVK